jgi:MPBQ/MSBQ methyltransferase
MRAAALELARLGDRDLRTLDVGAGTGFTTEGVVRHVDPARVVMLDQSPHQLELSRRRGALAACRRLLGDAEALPFGDGEFDRYISAGSIEYWPDPQRAIAEAYRVVRPGGIALVIGPLRRTHPIARFLSDAWMLFPSEDEYVAWFERAGFTDLRRVHVAPDWWRAGWDPYAVALAGVKPAPGASPLAPGPAPAEDVREPMTPRRLARFALGSLAGAAFIPIALWFTLRDRVAGRNRHPS